MRILVVEDEVELARLVIDRLQRAGFDADHAPTLHDARDALSKHSYSLTLLDRRLPDGDSVSLIPDIRRTHPGVRVLMLTALDTVSDKIAGLDAGADDYLTKPFDINELMARIRANLRRSGDGAAEPPVTVARHRSGPVCSIDHVAGTAEEKRKLHSTGAIAVEMEAAGVAQRAQKLGVPFFCIKSVTDLADETMANDFNAVLRSDGRFDTMKVLVSSLRRPWVRLPELVRLRKRCLLASRSLGVFIADCRF